MLNDRTVRRSVSAEGLPLDAELLHRLRTHAARDFGPECVAHDMGHLDRVWRNCLTIGEQEGGDRLVLGAAAYVHDYHRVVERRTGTRVRPEAALEPVEQVLAATEFPRKLRSRVLACVAATGKHAFSGEVVGSGLEETILHDADTLDALGAVGIARAFMFGGSLQEPLWRADVKISSTYQRGFTASVIHHFYEKLLRLRDDMVTVTGKELATRRHDYMLEFLAQLSEEWQIRFQ